MRNFVTYLAVVLVVAAIIKPRAPVPGLGGWLRDYASFLRTCLRVGVIILLMMIIMVVVGNF